MIEWWYVYVVLLIGLTSFGSVIVKNRKLLGLRHWPRLDWEELWEFMPGNLELNKYVYQDVRFWLCLCKNVKNTVHNEILCSLWRMFLFCFMRKNWLSFVLSCLLYWCFWCLHNFLQFFKVYYSWRKIIQYSKTVLNPSYEKFYLYKTHC